MSKIVIYYYLIEDEKSSFLVKFGNKAESNPMEIVPFLNSMKFHPTTIGQ